MTLRMYPSLDITFISALMNSFVLYVKRSIALSDEPAPLYKQMCAMNPCCTLVQWTLVAPLHCHD